MSTTTNAKRNVAPSTTSSGAVPIHPISAPAIDGPITIGRCCAPPNMPEAFETAFSSSPRTSGMIERCDAMYGVMKIPSTKTIRTSSENVRCPVQ